jgi:glycine/D-amino acid oxidase-like deaminating enzyme
MHRYARLMPDCFRLYEQLWADIGACHLTPLPSIVLERESTPWIEASIVDLEAMGVPWREVPLAEVAALYPMINTGGLTRAVEFGGAGVLFPIRILTDLVVHLAAKGVVFHALSKVEAVDPEAGTVTVAGGKVFTGDQVVVAAGAWVDRLVPAIRGRAVPSRQAVLFLAPPTELAAAWAAAPIFLDLGLDSGTYTLPPRPGTRLKVGDHTFTRAGDADGDRAATDPPAPRGGGSATAGRRGGVAPPGGGGKRQRHWHGRGHARAPARGHPTPPRSARRPAPSRGGCDFLRCVTHQQSKRHAVDRRDVGPPRRYRRKALAVAAGHRHGRK